MLIACEASWLELDMLVVGNVLDPYTCEREGPR